MQVLFFVVEKWQCDMELFPQNILTAMMIWSMEKTEVVIVVGELESICNCVKFFYQLFLTHVAVKNVPS